MDAAIARRWSLESVLDPRALILFCVIFSLVVACLKNIDACLAALAFSLCALVIARPAPGLFFKRFFAANVFLLFIWLVVPWTSGGEPVLQWGHFAISKTGLDLCILVTIKANALLLMFLVLLVPLHISTLGNALMRLGVPDKLTWLFLLMGRNIHVLGDEWGILTQAARLRGFKAGTNMHTYRTLAALLALLLLRANDRAERMREAMLLRGFNGRLPPGRSLRFSFRDALFGLLLLLCLSIIFYLEFSHVA